MLALPQLLQLILEVISLIFEVEEEREELHQWLEAVLEECRVLLHQHVEDLFVSVTELHDVAVLALFSLLLALFSAVLSQDRLRGVFTDWSLQWSLNRF